MKLPQICRLAIRREGNFVNAYIAQEEISNGRLIGSMTVECLEAQPETFTEWKDLMRRVIERFVKEVTGINVEFGGEEQAPEHERSGNA